MEKILPFSGISFFLLFFSFVLFLYVFKNILKKFIPFSTVLFISVVLYIYFCIPHADKILFFLVYVYTIYWIFVANKYQETIFPMMLIAIPMIMHKMDIAPIFKILGISYITFRTIREMTTSHNYGYLPLLELF